MKTRIDTILAPAGSVLRTLSITATSYHFTGCEWVSLITRNAPAHCSVLGWIALCKSSTGILNKTGIDTVSIHTGLSVPAVSITLAPNGLTSNLRIAHIARGTDTHWPMVLHEAGGSRSTVTGVNALSIYTGLTMGAVIIACTAWRAGNINRSTLGVCVRNPTFPTGTDHCPER